MIFLFLNMGLLTLKGKQWNSICVLNGCNIFNQDCGAYSKSMKLMSIKNCTDFIYLTVDSVHEIARWLWFSIAFILKRLISSSVFKKKHKASLQGTPLKWTNSVEKEFQK